MWGHTKGGVGAWSSNLAYLNLSHNMFSSIQVTSDVQPFTTALDTLNLSFNRLGGQIPVPNLSGRNLDY
jgi:3-oxoacyl-(acyl-carrier-protein) synthase